MCTRHEKTKLLIRIFLDDGGVSTHTHCGSIFKMLTLSIYLCAIKLNFLRQHLFLAQDTNKTIFLNNFYVLSFF